MSDFDTKLQPEPVCPHCGDRNGDAWEWNDNGGVGEHDCDSCGEPFEWERVVTVDYTTNKVRESIP